MEDMVLDIHHRKKQYDRIIKEINSLGEGEPKNTLLKYVEYHEGLIQKNKMTIGSAQRSISIACRICDFFENPKEIKQEELERWFSEEMKRKSLRRAGNDVLIPSNKQISDETARKIGNQLIKFLKFVEFLKLNKPVSLFFSKRIPVPSIAQFCIMEREKSKKYEPPLVSQLQVKQIIDELRTSTIYTERLSGVLMSFLNDTGARFGEAISLRHENLTKEGDNWIVQYNSSKTATRTNVLILSEDYIKNWVANCPTNPKKLGHSKGLIFSNRNGNAIEYSLIRSALKKTLRKLNIPWKNYSAVHYFRHLTASRFAEMPDNLIKYYFGWEDSSMRANYSAYNYKMVMPYLIKANQNNPMLSPKFSYMDEQEKTIEEKHKQEILLAVEKLIEARKIRV